MSSRWLVRTVMAAVISVELAITIAATWVYLSSTGRIVDADELSPAPRTALVLGSLVADGEPGDYLRGRLDTTVDLWRSSSIDRIILSGNGSEQSGDEPTVMADYLLARGIPASVLVADAAGYDTALSCRGAREVLDADAVLIITQDFHLDRAIALCRAVGVDATGVVANCDCPIWTVLRNHLRELVLANPRALLSALAS